MDVRLSLEQITAWDLSPDAFVDLAGALGCEAVSLFVEAATPESAGPPLVEDHALRRACRERLEATGVRLHTLECFAFAADTQVDRFLPALAAGAELGGKAATAIVFDPDRARTQDRLAVFAEMARGFGISVNVEFIAKSELRSLEDAASLVRAVGAPGMGIVVDSLHWTRSGGTVEALTALDPALIGAVQICDGPADMAPELQLFHEGFLQRRIPGEGAFALDSFVGALPRGRLIGVEVPLQDLAEQGVPVEERARRAVEGTRRLLEENGYGA